MESEAHAGSGITLEAIFDGKTLEEKTLKQPHWMNDGRRLALLDTFPETDKQTVWIWDTDSGERAPLFDPAVCRVDGADEPQTIHSFRWSPDERLLLFTQEAPARFKPFGNLFLYEVDSGVFRRLTNTGQSQRSAFFSHDSRWVGVVRSDDLWLISLETGEERRLTQDADPAVYNGRYGWVYEEELGLVDGWAWSPDDRWIACVQMDETQVPEYLLPRYDEPHAEPEVTRYPKAGDPNPVARIRLIDVESGDARWLDLGREEHYVARFQWTPTSSGLLVQRIPRLQNRLDLLFFPVDGGAAQAVLTESDDAWVNVPGDLCFVGETDRFVWPSDRDGHRHIYLYDVSGRCSGRLTSGDFDVDEVCRVPNDGPAYFVAATPDPTERRICRAPLNGGPHEALIDLSGWQKAQFSKDCCRFLLTRSTMESPPVQEVRDASGGLIRTLVEDTVPGLAACRPHGCEVIRFTTSDGVELRGRMMKPPNLAEGARCPALMCVYGGPGSQVVTNAWSGTRALWLQTLVDSGYVVFMVDGRGTGGRGRDFQKLTYQNLGYWETHDQIEGAKCLARLPYIDPARIGIWGWSYGGYMALSCLVHGADVFRAGVAVAPVTDWHLYDTIYTERYMRTPAENADRYRESAPTTHAEKLKGKLLLVHGLMDDNVHFQNSARFAAALQNAKIPFESMFYPGKRHGIEDVHPHLYAHMRGFLLANL